MKRRRDCALSGSFLRWREVERVLRSYREVLRNDRSMPLHWQVEQALKRAIGLLEGGKEEPFFSEREIAELLSVSAATANRAMKALIAEGCVRRRRGRRGYAVAPTSIVMRVEGSRAKLDPSSIRGEASNVLMEGVSRRVLSDCQPVKRVTGWEGDVLEVDQLVCSSAKPVMLERTYLPVRRFPRIRELSELELACSIASLIADKWGVRAEEAVEETSISRVGFEEAELLGVSLWKPCLRLRRTLYEFPNHTAAFLYSRSWTVAGIAASVHTLSGGDMLGERSGIDKSDGGANLLFEQM